MPPSPLKLYYTAPCEVVFVFHKDCRNGTHDFARKNVQLFLVELPEKGVLLFCVFEHVDEGMSFFNCRITADGASSMRDLKVDLLDIHMGDYGLFLSFPFEELLVEFRETVSAWFAGRSSDSGEEDMTSTTEDVVGPNVGGIDGVFIANFLYKASEAVRKTLATEGAEMISGNPETLDWGNWEE